tara:strand:+ start:1584 stop:2744 length:1161 start_codon:yes stop_codon:yes gene_type:complete
MLSKDIKFKNFKGKKINKSLKIFLKNLIDKKDDKNNLINSFTTSYLYSFNKKKINKYRKFNNYEIYGMGGSSLGAEAIYNFMKYKIKKKFYFFNNLDTKNHSIKNKKKSLNIIISKSGNTLETIVNENIFSKKNKLYITEKTDNSLRNQALKLKAEIINHKNFIGGRYSVLSEVGMLPAELMGLSSSKFKRFDKLILNKKFINSLIINVNSIYDLVKRKKTNSIILNYDESSNGIFRWYQQLVAESLGKNSNGVLPIISEMPKDNHSLMQLYLDGNKNSFFTFFDVIEKKSFKIKNNKVLKNFKYLKNHTLQSIKFAQKQATKNVFKIQKIPFRSFEILKKNEETLGELFTFFMLETILLGRMMKINPFDQPAVELIKKETKKILN